MLLAIDAGNTQTVFGLHDGSEWRAVWRWATDPSATEDQLAAVYFGLCRESGLEPKPRQAICANVVPALSESLRLFGTRWLGVQMISLSVELLPGLKVVYDPPSAVGADRLANALAVHALYSVPAIVVDFGTATTFDAIGPKGEYLGGVILPGVEISMEALFQRAARLPKVEVKAPPSVIGTDTVGSLQSGLVYGYAGAVDAIVRRMKPELGGTAQAIATGGLASLYAPHCEEIAEVAPRLTLDGLRLAAERLRI
ncbi:MAG: type III pantothenate kinase [Armatimonadetes bacterium]|nr:type III pantothenate kinase [Armatimonadota bacterium]